MPPSPDAPQARPWPPARVVTDAVFTALAAVQRGRAFHRRGRSFTASVEPEDAGNLSLPFLAAGRHDALVRLSTAVGLPSGAPDVHGLAIRLPDAYGPGAHQDMLLATAGRRPGVRHLLVPTRGFDRRVYSSLLLYRCTGHLLLLGAHHLGRRSAPLRLDQVDAVVAANDLTFQLTIARVTGPWRAVARIRLHEPLVPADSERLRFHPWNTSPQLRPVGPLNHLRAAAYEASQRTAASE